MAKLEQRSSQTYDIIFWFNGTRYKRSLQTKDLKRARDCVPRLDDTQYRERAGQHPRDVQVMTSVPFCSCRGNAHEGRQHAEAA